jgi:hypothetical protein
VLSLQCPAALLRPAVAFLSGSAESLGDASLSRDGRHRASGAAQVALEITSDPLHRAEGNIEPQASRHAVDLPPYRAGIAIDVDIGQLPAPLNWIMLTSKQARFVEEYIVDLNGKQAAIRAGYSPKTSEVQASRLPRYAKVQAAVREAMQARSRRTGITADRVVCELAELAFSNIFDFIEVHVDGSVHIDLLRATRDRAAAVHDCRRKAKRRGLRQ